MSMYADYVKETRGIESLETDFGFATYIIRAGECYIEDIYVKPQFRKDRVGAEMADKIRAIAKEQGCKLLTGTVNCLFHKDPSTSAKVLLAYGFKISKVVNDVIFFKMEIE